ncbi:MAG: TonB-dependent receptor, partial [Bacteroidota bacterium]
FSGIDRMEVIRGPGSSLYGAGTGGVVLLETRQRPERIRAEMSAGGYGLFRAAGGYHAGDDKRSIDIRLARQSADGYRVQSAMERDVIQLSGHLAAGKKTTLSLYGFSSALNYQTPGGLTLAQYKLDPSQARPAAGPNPGAVQQEAAVSNATTFAGVSAEHRHNENWNSTLTVYGNATDFSNPAIRNYEQRKEQSAGLRWISKYTFTRGQLVFGAEAQWGGSDISVFQNLSGKKGTLQSRASAPAATGMLFIQADKEFSTGWFLTGGLSVNRYRVKFSQTVPDEFSDVQNPSVVVIPRLAISKKFTEAMIVYASAGQGFSPPTVAEVFPSVAVYNKALRAERGTNLEMGVRGTTGPVQYSLSGFRLLTDNTIVIRRDESGADYFINAGETLQNGLEAMIALQDTRRKDWIKDLRGWMSYTRADYRFLDYVKGANDFSGNRLTGTPRDMASAGVELLKGSGLQASVTANYCGALPLNDAGTDLAAEYYTFAARIGYRTRSSRYPLELFAGGENLLDRRYSLRNDLKAVAGRSINAASGRMLYA